MEGEISALEHKDNKEETAEGNTWGANVLVAAERPKPHAQTRLGAPDIRMQSPWDDTKGLGCGAVHESTWLRAFQHAVSSGTTM